MTTLVNRDSMFTKQCLNRVEFNREVKGLTIASSLGLSPSIISVDNDELTICMTYIEGTHPDESLDLYECDELNSLYSTLSKNGVTLMDITHGNFIIDVTGKWWAIDFSDSDID